jgi:hypothetical protein
MSEGMFDDLMERVALSFDQLRRSVSEQTLAAAAKMAGEQCPGLADLHPEGQHALLTRAERGLNMLARDAKTAMPSVAYSILTGYHAELLKQGPPQNALRSMDVNYFALTSDLNTPYQYRLNAEGFHDKARVHAEDAYALETAALHPNWSFAYKLIRFADVCFHLHRLRGQNDTALLDKTMQYLQQGERKLVPGTPGVQADARQAMYIARNMASWFKHNPAQGTAAHRAEVGRLVKKWQGYAAVQAQRPLPSEYARPAPDKKAL